MGTELARGERTLTPTLSRSAGEGVRRNGRGRAVAVICPRLRGLTPSPGSAGEGGGEGELVQSRKTDVGPGRGPPPPRGRCHGCVMRLLLVPPLRLRILSAKRRG